MTVMNLGTYDEHDREEHEYSWWDRFRSERRWVIAAILIALVIFAAVFAIIFNRIATAGQNEPEAEPGTSVRLSAAEPGSSAVVGSQNVPRTVLQVTGRDGAVGAQTVVVLDEEVLFDFDRAALRPESAQVLDQLADLIVSSDDAAIDVVGFTDAVGGEFYNLELSRDRAEAVVSYLSGQGVAAERLRAAWRGEEDPVAPNSGFLGGDNPDGRAQNRRVEVVIDENGRPQQPAPASGLGADQHPNGMVVAVDALRVVPGGVLLDVRLVNRAQFPVELADDPIWLVDDLGYTYRCQPSWQNPSLSIASGATLSGQLAFPGVVPPQASRFTLVGNVGDPTQAVDLSRRRDNDSTPSVVVERLPRG